MSMVNVYREKYHRQKELVERLKEQVKELSKSIFDNLVLRLDERRKLNAEIDSLGKQIEAERQAAEDERIMAASEYQRGYLAK
jgi:hypothetical protein